MSHCVFCSFQQKTDMQGAMFVYKRSVTFGIAFICFVIIV